MSRKGKPKDNPVAERFMRTFKEHEQCNGIDWWSWARYTHRIEQMAKAISKNETMSGPLSSLKEFNIILNKHN